MKEKSEVFTLFLKFFHMVKTQFGKIIKRLRSDNGREYVNHDMSKFLSENGIVHEFTCVHTPQQNSIVERKNRHLLEVLDPRAVKCIFIGYASNKKGYRCYHPPSRKFFTSMDVTFDETKSFYESPQLQGESSFEVESSESLESSFNPFIQEPSCTTNTSCTTIDTPNTSRMSLKLLLTRNRGQLQKLVMILKLLLTRATLFLSQLQLQKLVVQRISSA